MKTAMSVLALATATAGLPASYIHANEGLLWANFKETYGKQYSGADEAGRRAIFKRNMLKAAEREAGSTATHGMNRFTDLTQEEFKVYHSLRMSKKAAPAKLFSESEVLKVKDTSVDWRTQGVVTHVNGRISGPGTWGLNASRSGWSA